MSLILNLIEPDPRPSLLKRALSHGWQAFGLVSNNRWYRLPNRTLQGGFPDDSVAEAAFEGPARSQARKMPRHRYQVDHGVRFRPADSDE